MIAIEKDYGEIVPLLAKTSNSIRTSNQKEVPLIHSRQFHLS